MQLEKEMKDSPMLNMQRRAKAIKLVRAVNRAKMLTAISSNVRTGKAKFITEPAHINVSISNAWNGTDQDLLDMANGDRKFRKMHERMTQKAVRVAKAYIGWQLHKGRSG